MEEVIVDHGKYRFFIPENDYRIHIERYGEPWLILEQGSKAIASLIQALLQAKEYTTWLKDEAPESKELEEIKEFLSQFSNAR